MKRQKSIHDVGSSYFDLLSEEIVFSVLDCLNDSPLDKKSFSLVCKSFCAIESRHRKSLKPLRLEHLAKILCRYPYVTDIDLCFCPRISDTALSVIASSCREMLRSVNLSMSKFFSHVGLSNLVMNCVNLVEIDLSNATDLKDMAASAIAEAKNLEKLWLVRCKSITDIGIGCIAVGCKKLRLLSLKWCLGVGDLGVGLVAFKCNDIRSLDLSYLPFFSHVGLSNLVMNCVNLVEIDLSNATDLKDMAASAIAEAKNLEKLWLVRCKSITDIGIGCIAVGCKKLRLLSLKWCLGVGDLGVGLVAFKCNDIRSLDLSYLPITSLCLTSILKLQHLEDLVLEGCFGIDDDSLAAFKDSSKTLATLDMSSCQNVSHVGLSSLTSGTGCLRQLVLAYGSPVTLALADSLQKLPMLQSIKLDGCQVTCSGLKAIGDHCVSLRELSLSKCLGVTDEGLSSIVTKHRDLRKLDITCCRKITDVSIANTTNSCRLLTSLKMESCTLVSVEAFFLIGQWCQFLEELDLTDNEIDDEGLKSIASCSRLSSLKLGICLNITDEGLIHIGMCCPKLTELDLYRSAGVTDSGILAIACGCASLEMINIAYCKDITDRSLISLAKCSNLSVLESRGCPLITSLGMAAIAVGCRQLTKLDIKKCHNIHDVGMIPLGHFSQNLRQINLSYTSVTDVGLLSLASVSCLQNLTILHLKGLTPSGLAGALLACGGLAKVKLHASFRSLLPPPIFEHLEARGCVFHWRDKVCQAELDPKCWKLQLNDVE